MTTSNAPWPPNKRPKQVKIVEVGPRDGLQNEKHGVDTLTKVELIERLAFAGVTHIEAGSFVNPKWVPQMSDSDAVFEKIARKPGVTYAALTPNLQGFERALSQRVSEVAVFTAASETFSQNNINCSIAESLVKFEAVMESANRNNIQVRAYISCVLGCPYEGAIAAEKVSDLCQQLMDMGCYEISLGDTTGVGTTGGVLHLIRTIERNTPMEKLAVHFHDTYGQALANIYAALECGIAVVDSAVAGMGGCPYADGASGNVATEDVVYMLNGLGIECGIDLKKLINTGDYISQRLNRCNQSKTANALSQKLFAQR